MQTTDYISREVPALLPTDKVGKAKGLFKKLTYTHLPVVEDASFLGMISEADIQPLENKEQPLDEIRYLFQSFFVSERQNWFELLKIFALNETTILPIIDDNHQYLGYYELSDILRIFNNTPFLSENGAILVISKGINDYSFSQIAQIVESNNAKLLGAFISNFEDEMVEITLKLSDHDLNTTIQTFRRYSYDILTSFHVDEYLNTLKERSEYLQRYLNI